MALSKAQQMPTNSVKLSLQEWPRSFQQVRSALSETKYKKYFDTVNRKSAKTKVAIRLRVNWEASLFIKWFFLDKRCSRRRKSGTSLQKWHQAIYLFVPTKTHILFDNNFILKAYSSFVLIVIVIKNSSIIYDYVLLFFFNIFSQIIWMIFFWVYYW